MALRQIEVIELGIILQKVCASATNDRYTTGLIYQALYNTGLRVQEVLETWRWERTQPDTYTVKLSKREDSRTIPASNIPAGLQPYLDHQRPFVMETYSAVNNCFKYYAPGIIVEGKRRRTTCHAFRYHYIKELRASGLTVSEIAAHMGHKVEASSMGYIMAMVWVSGG